MSCVVTASSARHSNPVASAIGPAQPSAIVLRKFTPSTSCVYSLSSLSVRYTYCSAAGLALPLPKMLSGTQPAAFALKVVFGGPPGRPLVVGSVARQTILLGFSGSTTASTAHRKKSYALGARLFVVPPTRLLINR